MFSSMHSSTIILQFRIMRPGSFVSHVSTHHSFFFFVTKLRSTVKNQLLNAARLANIQTHVYAEAAQLTSRMWPSSYRCRYWQSDSPTFCSAEYFKTVNFLFEFSGSSREILFPCQKNFPRSLLMILSKR